MGLLSNQMVGLIELTPSSDPDRWCDEDGSLEATFQRLVRDELDDADGNSSSSGRTSRLAAPRSNSTSAAATSVVYVDSEQLDRELHAEWRRLRGWC